MQITEDMITRENIQTLETIFSILPLVILVVVTLLTKDWLYRMMEKNPGSVSLIAVLCFIFVYPIPAYIIAYRKYSANRKAVDDELVGLDTEPTEELVDKYIEAVKKYGISNTPQNWNVVRGIWFVVNESSDITTEKKKELRNLLMSKGLRLVGNDKNVIDNYKG